MPSRPDPRLNEKEAAVLDTLKRVGAPMTLQRLGAICFPTQGTYEGRSEAVGRRWAANSVRKLLQRKLVSCPKPGVYEVTDAGIHYKVVVKTKNSTTPTQAKTVDQLNDWRKDHGISVAAIAKVAKFKRQRLSDILNKRPGRRAPSDEEMATITSSIELIITLGKTEKES
jgi:hypothetical protein